MKYFLLSALILIGFASCEKATTPESREDELRKGKWKKIAGTEEWDPAIGEDKLINYFAALDTCKKDDYLVFGTNFSVSQFTGVRCDNSEPEEIPFRWDLYDNGKSINFWSANQTFFNQSAVSAPFVSYSPNEFTIKYTEYLPNKTDSLKRDTVTYTHTFAKF